MVQRTGDHVSAGEEKTGKKRPNPGQGEIRKQCLIRVEFSSGRHRITSKSILSDN
ncbi:MAG: hypothetical protein PHQ23_14800 [Candidatus Wallbacteria bacterium]|nr:hypothetical protein [Candidatus Wallbacteria bacterium]